MPETNRDDCALLCTAVREAGTLALEALKGTPKTWSKSHGNPVTETDIAIDRFLHDRLHAARPDYGWLSEETSDDATRIKRDRVFVVDPIDGTTAFIKKKPEFTVCAAVIQAGAPVAAAIYNPMTDEMFSAALGHGAKRNGAPLRVSTQTSLEACRMLVARDVIEHPAWPQPWPRMDLGKRASIAYRMALVAAGEYDAMMALSSKHEWDTAAGTLIVSEAGGLATSHRGAALVYNQAIPLHRSLICAGPALHAAILERTGNIFLP